MWCQIIYSFFVIFLGLLVFLNKIQIEQYSMYFVCFCLFLPVFITLIDKFQVIKIGSFFEFSKKLENIEKQQEILFKQISLISNQTNINNFYANKDIPTPQEVQDNKQLEIGVQLNENGNFNEGTSTDKPLKSYNLMDFMSRHEAAILNYYLKNKSANNIDISPQALNYSTGDNINRKVYFDAFFKVYNTECFVEIKMVTSNSRVRGAINQRLEAIKTYNLANKKNACLIMLLIDTKECSQKSTEAMLSDLRLNLQDYIQANLLYIEHYDYQTVQAIIDNKEQ